MALLELAHHENNSSGARSRTIHWVQSTSSLQYQRFCPAEAWTPSINLCEDDQHYYVVADLAGVKAEDIELKVNLKGVMVLSGRRDTPEPVDLNGELKLHLMEIDHGDFCRSIQLPADADVERIDATTRRGGLLWIRIPKKD